MMKQSYKERIKSWNDKFGWILSIIALPSLLSDLSWWVDAFKYILSIAPEWVSTTIIFIRDSLKPILDAYEFVVVTIFSIFPFSVPKWLSISLPPVLSLSIASLMAYSIYKRAKEARLCIDMMNDSRFIKSSVIWRLISNKDISFPKMQYFRQMEEHELMAIAKPQVDQLERSMAIRLFVLNGLISIYAFVLLIELIYRLVELVI